MGKSKKKKQGVRRKITQFEIIRSQVAGIDVSDNSGMMVAYPISSSAIVVEEYECYTCDLHLLSKTLKSQMNLKIHTVLSDIDGKTGMAIINAILSGERAPEKLADLCDRRVKASREEIIKSKNDGVMPKLGKLKRKSTNKNSLTFNATDYLYELNKVDFAGYNGITGISELTALTIYSEVGELLAYFKKEEYNPQYLVNYQEKWKERKIKNVEKYLAKLKESA